MPAPSCFRRAAAPSQQPNHGLLENDLREELEALEKKLQEQIDDSRELSKVLDQERRRVTELERERELQNKSLNLLHQQLELARESGSAATAADSEPADQEAPESGDDGAAARASD